MPRLAKSDPVRQNRRADVFLFSMDAAEVASVAAGRLPSRIRRACFVIDPLLHGDQPEYLRRTDAERRGTLDAVIRAAARRRKARR